MKAPVLGAFHDNDDIFYLFLQEQKIGAKLHIYLYPEGECQGQIPGQ